MNWIHSVTCITSCKEKGKGEGRGIAVILALLGSLFSCGSRFLEWQPPSLEKLGVPDDIKETLVSKTCPGLGCPFKKVKRMWMAPELGGPVKALVEAT